MSEKEYEDYTLTDEIETDEIIVDEELPPLQEFQKEELFQSAELKGEEALQEAALEGEQLEDEVLEEKSRETFKQVVTQGFAYKKGENQTFEEKINQEQIKEKRNTSFNAYIYESERKNKRGFRKWLFGGIKLLIFLMCLPFIIIVLGGVFGVAAACVGGSIALIGGGIFLLASAAFFAQVLGNTLILLAITSSITLVATGLLGALICYIVIRWFIYKAKGYYHRHKQNKQIKEER
ncbi:hypothetical protein CS063_16070 [Sporanaerobium hydrogeniformans]|uniref:Uncharacterized protein n=1 Tax=Sporanaerobium hydrogeniformans TaxID=3072179 RepID=A0AC61D9X5_9FIRM|nr:DUF4013 domain-containing protein [Sporanaerobium hydrogeniformans]PHV69397.1 hypothetical protein CS063_16070 [Sporanaerobium hydrogeniformans]